MNGVCIIGLLVFNYKLAQIYLSSTGKTRALFGLTELARLDGKSYLIPFIISAILFAAIEARKKETKIMVVVTMILSLLSIGLFSSGYGDL